MPGLMATGASLTLCPLCPSHREGLILGRVWYRLSVDAGSIHLYITNRGRIDWD